MLTVSEETSLGIPALIWAWRDGIWPWPACSTWPITTCWTWSGLISARSSAASIAVPPSSVASTLDSPPPSLPKGVRAALSTTVLLIDALLVFLALGVHYPRARDGNQVLTLSWIMCYSASSRV